MDEENLSAKDLAPEHKEGHGNDPFLVTLDGPDGSLDPQSWPTGRKWTQISMISAMTLLVYVTGGASSARLLRLIIYQESCHSSVRSRRTGHPEESSFLQPNR